ncbi:uncharacterized protein MELLADRAFT_91574 [Melampsora larici-populina 98AG31]|uniref:Uncharacterized protein n=1 Tax=Melampsora larici-populina (strain 98AG31 / pathotype 3-4-7) TaxID=747676 RepID=F4RZJ7_MELLP|nr:uncharacterized protein MELLADRAFT_91574 [Melampsora larici-populina 98AG31]EGG02245.1 hypothetical protein MELLADRAFT_91574 [Melampsora larici-populina 98AG31]
MDYHLKANDLWPLARFSMDYPLVNHRILSRKYIGIQTFRTNEYLKEPPSFNLTILIYFIESIKSVSIDILNTLQLLINQLDLYFNSSQSVLELSNKLLEVINIRLSLEPQFTIHQLQSRLFLRLSLLSTSPARSPSFYSINIYRYPFFKHTTSIEMAPTTPSAKKNLVHRPQSTSSKKIKPYKAPSRRQSEVISTSTPLLTQALASEILNLDSTGQQTAVNQAKPLADTQDDDVEMANDSNSANNPDSHPVTQSSTASNTLPSSNQTKGKKDDDDDEPSEDDGSGSDSASGDSDDEGGENDDDDANHQSIKVEPTTIEGSDDLEIIGGHIMTEATNIVTRMPFRKSSSHLYSFYTQLNN